MLPPDKFVDPVFIQKNLKSRFSLEMPVHAVVSVLKRACKKKLIEVRNQKYRLTESGQKYLEKLEANTDVERRINEVRDDIIHFFNGRGIEINAKQTDDILNLFLATNLEPLLQFADSSFSSELKLARANTNQIVLTEYIEDAEKKKPAIFKTLKDMILGSLISVVLKTSDASEIASLEKRRFKKCKVYFDTNVLLAILGLTRPEFVKPAKELKSLLDSFNFEMFVFDFTIDEVSDLLSKYPSKAIRYPMSVKVDSLFSNLKINGWDKSDVREFIAGIEETLHAQGITVECTEINNLDVYDPLDESLRGAINRHKPQQDKLNQNHDLAAVEMIEKLRGKNVRRLEDSRAFFLSSDKNLWKFDLIEMGHNQKKTIPEVVLDRFLATMLWLKNPNSDPPLATIIAAHSSNLFVNRKIWDKFYNVLRELHDEDEIKEKDISTLFFDNYIQDALVGLEESDVNEVTREFVLDKVEEAAKRPTEAVKEAIDKKEEDLLKHLDKELTKKASESEKAWFRKLKKIRNNIKISSKSSARKRIGAGRIILAITAGIPLLVVLRSAILNKDFNRFYIICGFITIFLFISGIAFGSWQEFWNRWIDKYEDKIYRLRIKNAGIDDIEKLDKSD